MSYPRWDAEASDVPGGRVTRSVAAGLAGLKEREREKIVEKRKSALDRLRAAANAAESDENRELIWGLLDDIATEEGPSWAEVVAARYPKDFLSLSMRYGGDDPEEGEAGASFRTVAASIDAYIDFKEGFAANTLKNSKSVLERAKQAPDPKAKASSDRTFGERNVMSVSRSDVQPLLEELPARGSVKKSTLDDYRKHLRAWYYWELAKEEERAEERGGEPLFTSNPFVEEEALYSAPRQGRHKTVQEAEHGRRFMPDEVEALLEAADVRTRTVFLTCHRLGLRPGELIHLRWMDDVRPLDESDGFRVDIQGGRGRDPRCNCRPCATAEGWAPKVGPRTYHLERKQDHIGWTTPLIDALERWVALLDPDPGDFLFPSPADRKKAWTNQSLNRRLHRLADQLRESGRLPGFETGRDASRRLTMHSWRHTCASEMVERGVPAALAADWIGDDLRTFKEVYEKPRPRLVAAATLAGYGEEGTE